MATRYESAFQILHKVRTGMVRPECDCIGGEHVVEFDERYLGSKTRGEGKGVHHKTTVVGAVEIRRRKEVEQCSDKYRKVHEGGVPLKQLVTLVA